MWVGLGLVLGGCLGLGGGAVRVWGGVSGSGGLFWGGLHEDKILEFFRAPQIFGKKYS